jgi:multidrug efflux pump subunit AcrA (membrane-fusion protein)
VLVKPGQAVRAGQSLLRLDPRDAKLANSAAEVQLQAARAKLANVEADFSRYTELLKKGFISKAEWDRREALLIAERAQFEVTLDQLGVYTLRALEPGVVRRVLAKKSQVVEAAELVIELQLRQLSKATPPEAPQKQLAKPKGTEPSQAEVFRIPLTALLEGRSVMRLVPNNDQFLVEPTAVNVLEATESHALVEGLLKGDSIVAVGAHLLSPGQKVRRLTP